MKHKNTRSRNWDWRGVIMRHMIVLILVLLSVIMIAVALADGRGRYNRAQAEIAAVCDPYAKTAIINVPRKCVAYFLEFEPEAK